MNDTKRVKRHSTAIRRNTALHNLVFGQIAAAQEQADIAVFRTLTMRQREAAIGYRPPTIGRITP